MDSVYDALKLFPFPMSYPCRACKKCEHEPKKFFEHLEECVDARMNPGLKRLMTYEARWQETFVRFRITQALISRGGHPLDDEDCAGCQSFENHEAGKCTTEMSRVDLYKTVVIPLIDQLFAFYNFYLHEADEMHTAEVNAHYERLWALELEEKTHEDSKTAKRDQRKINKRVVEKTRKSSDAKKKCGLYRIRMEKFLELPTQKLYNSFVILVRKMQEEDLEILHYYDTNVAHRENLMVPRPEPFNNVLNKKIIKRRVTMMVGEEVAKVQARSSLLASFDSEDYRIVQAIREAQEAIENKRRDVLRLSDPTRITHQDRLECLRELGILSDNAIFATDQEFPTYVSHYNNATGWYHATIEHHQTTSRRVFEKMPGALAAGRCVEFCRLMMEYVKARRLLEFALGFTEAATRALSSLHGYQGPLNDPTDAHKAVQLHSGQVANRFSAHNAQVYSVLHVETCKHLEKIRETMRTLNRSSAYFYASKFVRILQRFVNEDYNRSDENNLLPAMRFTSLVHTYGSFNFNRPQPGAHIEREERDRQLAMNERIIQGIQREDNM